MSGTLLLLAVITCGVVVGLMWLMAAYNSLLNARQKISGLFSQLETQLTRRHALLQELTEAAQSASSSEGPAWDAFIRAQSESRDALAAASGPARSAGALQRLLAAESRLSATLAPLLGALDRRPAWKTNPLRDRLAGEIANTETESTVLKAAYNDSVTGYNAQLQEIPSLWIALLTGLSPENTLQTEVTAEPDAPKTRFSASA